jgi:hypothetical protein
MNISRKLKTVLGDSEGLQQEVALLLQEDAFKSLAEGLDTKHGGKEEILQKWNESHFRLCKSCGKTSPIQTFIFGPAGNLFCVQCTGTL